MPAGAPNHAFIAWLEARMRAAGYPPEGDERNGGRTRLAATSGLSLSVISRLLSTGRTPKLETMLALARALRVSLDEMLVAAGLATSDDFSFAPGYERLEPIPMSVEAAIDADPLLDRTDRAALRKHYRGLREFNEQKQAHRRRTSTEHVGTSPPTDAPSPDPLLGRDPPALSHAND